MDAEQLKNLSILLTMNNSDAPLKHPAAVLRMLMAYSDLSILEPLLPDLEEAERKGERLSMQQIYAMAMELEQNKESH